MSQIKAPIMGQPAGQVLDLQNTNELQPGDVIYVEFPWGSLGRINYGASEAFTVFGFDPAANKVGVTDQSGAQAWFDGGTKAQLLSKLQEKTSFSSLSVIRPYQAAPPIQQQPLSSSEQELVDGAAAIGLPGGLSVLRTAFSMGDLLPGDYLYSVNPLDVSKRRLWKVVDTTPPDRIWLILAGTTVGADATGEMISIAKTDIIQRDYQMPFREAPANQPPLTSGEWCPAGGAPGSKCAGPEGIPTPVIVGGGAAIAAIILYLLFG